MSFLPVPRGGEHQTHPTKQMELVSPESSAGGGQNRRPTPEERAGLYKPGSIKRVRLRNFLTYADVEFCPGPRLNVVIGPNGTGKSTILCAICLGLGGEPPLLGRADDARTFIMHEKDKAVIEIELATIRDADGNPGPVNVIRRVIDRSKGTERGRGKGASTFYINSDIVNKKEVLKLVQDTYHLAVDNLCTFLPQDRVGSFSGFDSKQLLQETEKSLSGSKHLFNQHEQLITMERDIRTSTGSVETIADKLQQLEEEAQQLETLKERMEERQEAEKQIDLLEQKRAWLKFDEKRKEANDLKEEKNQAKKKLHEARKSLAPLQQALSEVSEQVEQLKANRSELEKQQNRSKQAQTKDMKKFHKITDELEDLLNDLAEIDSARRNLQRKVDAQKKRVDDAVAVLAEMPEAETINKEFADANNEIKQVRSQLNKAKNEWHRTSRSVKDLQNAVSKKEKDLMKIQDEHAQRRQRIFHKDPKLAETYDWVHKNQKHFRQPVLGPIIAEITDVEDEDVARYLEQHVPNATLKSYIVQCKEDYNFIYNEVRNKRKLPINIMIVDQIREPNRPHSEQKMNMLKRDHGIQFYLEEAVTAPDLVMQALRNASQIDQVLVGNERSERSMKGNLMDLLTQREDGSLKSGCVITCDGIKHYKHTGQVSRHSGKVFMRQDEIKKKAEWLTKGTDPDAVATLEREIDDIRADLQQQIPRVREEQQNVEALQKEGQEYTRRRDEAKAAKSNLVNAQKKVQNARRKLQELEEDASKDSDAEKNAIVKKLMKHLSAKISSLEAASSHYDEVMTASHRLCGVKMNDAGVIEKQRLLREAIDDKEAESHALEDSFERIKRQFNEAKAMIMDLKKEAAKYGELTDEIKATLEGLPNSTDEVEALLTDALEKVSGIEDNPEVLRRYEERTREIAETREELENLNEAKDVKRQALESLANPWKAALENTLTKVNALFSEYMSELGCAGEVRLRKGQSEQQQDSLGDYAEWGVEILVKFREKSPLQVLSAHHHSGGERSVSTIMYLMALQDLMVSPFRCVDEINQGLDERNERLVFRRIVENSTRPPKQEGVPHTHIGQYFLITPKLLPNLTDMENDDVTVLCIFNGPFNFSRYSDWNVDKFLSARKRIRANAAEDSDDESGYARSGESSRAARRAETENEGNASPDEEEDDVDEDAPRKRRKRKVDM